MRASAVVEQAGIPTASLACEGFVEVASSAASGLGMPNLPVAMIPGHVDAQSSEELRGNLGAVTLDAVVEHLTADPPGVPVSQDLSPSAVVFRGSSEDVNRIFYEKGWSDGLPIVPPTRERIAAFLAETPYAADQVADQAADHVIGTVGPEQRQATLWNIAVNGVMANCRPEYMPLLVALVEVMIDPGYCVEQSGDSTGGEALIVVSGPVIDQLQLNAGQGALRDGYQANTAIGRFWRLYLRNVGGFRPGAGDKCTFGATWRVALAENEAEVRRIGWRTFHADRGFRSTDSVVTVGRYTGSGVVGSIYGNRPEEIIDYLADGLVRQVGWELAFAVGLAPSTARPLLVISPLVAETFARAGLSKADVQALLFERARLPAQKLERYIGAWSNLVAGRRTLNDLAALGLADPVFAESSDPQRLVPIASAPEHFLVVVSGDAMRANAIAFGSNGMHGFPTSKPVHQLQT